jgi:hypothetical protein
VTPRLAKLALGLALAAAPQLIIDSVTCESNASIRSVL